MKKVLFVFAFIICALFSVHLDARDVTRDVIGMRGEPIDKSKVMKAKRVCVPGLELICEDGIFKIKGQAWITRFSDDEKEELKNIDIDFNPKRDNTFVSVGDNEIRFYTSSDDCSMLEFSVFLHMNDEDKSYELFIMPSNYERGQLITADPQFCAKANGHLLDIIGIESSSGRTPVLLEWLEKVAKKCNFKIAEDDD